MEDVVPSANVRAVVAKYAKITGSGAFEWLANSSHIEETSPQLRRQFLRVVYDVHLEDASKPYLHLDKEQAPAIKEAFSRELCGQDVFDFLICATMVSFQRDRVNPIVNDRFGYAFPSEVAMQTRVRRAFQSLRDRVADGVAHTEWVKECSEYYGSDFVSWIDRQLRRLDEKIAIAPDVGAAGQSIKEGFAADSEEFTGGKKFDVVDLSHVSREEAWAQLDKFVGLNEVKDQFQTMVTDALFAQVQKNICGIGSTSSFKNLVFVGSPGVGKSTMARTMGSLLASHDLLSRKQMIFCAGNDLVAPFQGHTEKVVDSLFKQGSGGLIVIDEIDSLVAGMIDFDHKVVRKLNSKIGYEKDANTGTIVILTGYKSGIDMFMAQDAGLSRRFHNQIVFDDYSENELRDIFTMMTTSRGFAVDSGVADEAARRIMMAKKALGERFGNAGTVEAFVDRMKSNRARSIGVDRLTKAMSDRAAAASLKSTGELNRFRVEDLPSVDPRTGTFKTADYVAAKTCKAAECMYN